MAAFMEADRFQAGGVPGVAGPLVRPRGGEGVAAVTIGEDGSVAGLVLLVALVEEVCAEGLREWDAPFAGSAFGVDEAGLAVPASADVDEVLFEVDVGPVECLQFAHAQAGVEGGRPEGAVDCWQGGEEGRCFVDSCDAVTVAAYSRQRQVERRVGGDLFALEGPTVDRPQRQKRVSDRARGAAGGKELIDEVLEHHWGDRAQLLLPEAG